MSSPDFIFTAVVGVLGLTALAFAVVLFSLVKLACGKGSPGFLVFFSVAWIAVVFYTLLVVVPPKLDSLLNGVIKNQKFHPVPEEHAKFHKTLSGEECLSCLGYFFFKKKKKKKVADLHADSLMWPKRDLLTKNNYSHVDVPRLLQGRIAIQAFTIVSSSPAKLNFHSNAEPKGILSDQIVLKALLEQWGGLEVIHSIRARAMFQIDQLHRFEARSNGALMVIKTKSDLENVLRLHANGQAVVGGFLGVEGLHCLDSDWKNVQVLYDAGVRMAALTHFFDNSLGGSAHGVAKNGLTELGRKVLSEMVRLGMLIDVAHNSHATIAEIIELTKGSNNSIIMTSHTGVQSVCDSFERNLNDDEIRAIAKSGGVVGIAFFSPAMCGDDILESILDSIIYVKNLVGIEHVGLGSDWDGTVKTPIDASQTLHISSGLLRRGLTEQETRLVMGENVFRMLRRVLP